MVTAFVVILTLTCAKGAHNREQAVEQCRAAVAQAATAQNMAELALILSDNQDPDHLPKPEELAQALELAKRAANAAPHDYLALESLCAVAAGMRRLWMLDDCAPGMLAIAPNDPEALWYSAIDESELGHQEKATELIAKARSHGLSAPEADLLSLVLAPPPEPWPDRLREVAKTIALIWLSGLLSLLAAGSILSAVTNRVAARVALGSAAGAGLLLRGAYLAVLALTALFYYCTLPILALLTTFLAGAVVYAFLSAGIIPISIGAWLLALFLLGLPVFLTLIAVSSIVASIFARRNRELRAVPVDLSTETRLRELLGEVAARLGTDPITRVFLVNGAALAVYRGGRERTLVIGAGLLDGLTVGTFRAMLAHEYGHFRKEGSAGGAIAMGLHRAMLTLADDLKTHGGANLLNPTWLFLLAFEAVFLQISGGASRLQEILADRGAAEAFGGAVLERGLRHVCLQSARVQAVMTAHAPKIFDGTEDNLYRLVPGVPEGSLEKDLKLAWERPMEDEDSHPSPRDRVEWTRAFVGAPDPGDGGTMVWSLFVADRAGLERKVTALLRPRAPVVPLPAAG